MIDALKRKLGLAQATAQADETNEGVVEMTTDVTTEAIASAEGTVPAEAAEQFAALQATVAALTEQLAGNATELAAKDSKIAELSALVEAAVDFKAAQEKIAAQAKVAARVAKLAEAVGTEQAEKLQVALASLDDTAFDVAVNAMSLKMKTEEQSPVFKEVGVEGTADASKLAADSSGSRVMDYLKTIDHNQSN